MFDLSSINNFDYLVFFITLVSTLYAFFKGFIKSFLYFFGWILAAVIVIDSYPFVSEYLSKTISSKLLINIVATLGMYIIVLVLITIINNKLIALTSTIIGGAVDRSLGFAFGFARGALICCALFWSLVTILNAWDNTKDPDWLTSAKSYKMLNQGTEYLASLIAADSKRVGILKLISENSKFKSTTHEALEKEK